MEAYVALLSFHLLIFMFYLKGQQFVTRTAQSAWLDGACIHFSVDRALFSSQEFIVCVPV